MPSTLKRLDVRTAPGSRTRGIMIAGPLAIPVALGRGGILANKREGDGATPRGRFRLVRLWWRADRGARPLTLLPVRRVTRHDAWCEDPSDRRYNQPIKAPSGDHLWRDDALYDLVIEIDHNTRPRIARHGSAVFIHVARDGLTPTAGCVALDKRRLYGLLSRLGTRTTIRVG